MLCLATSTLLPACGHDGGSETVLGASRTSAPVGRNIRWNASPGERYGVTARDFAGASGGGGGGMVAGDAGGGELHWSTPDGWVERPPAMFRDANFFVAGDERAECYLTTLGGPAGGLDANVNRWRAQVSLPPISAAEIAALPRVPWMGGQAVSLDVTGNWTGMSGDQAQSDYRLVGLALVQADQSRFLKMVGPADVIGGALGAFDELAASFHEAAGHQQAAAPADMAAGASMDLPEGHPPLGASTTAGASVAQGRDEHGNAFLTWGVPAGWSRGPEKSMREVTYFAGPANAVECYVTLLSGNGGGLLANINRWCGQMGAPVLSDADLAALERVPMAGAEGVVVRLARGSAATAPAGTDLLLGAVCQLPDRALFVKMTGPADAVDAQHGALLEFCMSLQVAK